MKHLPFTAVILFCTSFWATAQTFEAKQKKLSGHASSAAISKTISGNTYQRSGLVYSGNSAMNDLQKAHTSAPSLKQDQTTQVHRSEKTGLPIFISSLPGTSSAQFRSITQASPELTAMNYIKDLSSLFGIEQATNHFKIVKTESDPAGGWVVRMQQHFNSIEVYEQESVIHINNAGVSTSWNGSYTHPDLIKRTDFTITASVAAAAAVADIQKEVHYHELSATEKAFLGYNGPEIQQVLYTDNKLVQTCVPAYVILVRPNFVDWWTYIVDATTGNVLESFSNTCHADGTATASVQDLNSVTQSINTYHKGSAYYLIDASRSMFSASESSLPDNPVGAIQTLNMNNTWGANTSYSNIQSSNNTSWSTVAVSAHYNAQKAYEYYKTIHNRNSIDNLGGTIISFVNVADPDDGTPMDNAFWNGKAMCYGNGNKAFKPLAGGLDVGGHELTHGVVQSTANLNYKGESGAINESMADIFGCMIDSLDWLIGEDIVLTSAFPSGALRSLSNPHNGGTSLSDPGWQPRHVNEKYTGTGDNGGVHINSGITSYAFYLLAQSTKRYKAEKIFYRALSVYLTRSSQFIDLRLACVKSADDIYGSGSNESVQTGIAFDQVGITLQSTPVISPGNDVPINDGTEYILAVDGNPGHSYTLYRTTTSGTPRSSLSVTNLFSKPSITDDGSTAYFVNSANQIVSLYTTPGNTQEIILDDESVWNSVAISKDGSRLAATTIYSDTTIYVFDLNNGTGAAFTLYNPTFSEGIKSGGPLYADALEWDYTGQNIIYDCYNQFLNTSGSNINYWDINFIQVWDNTIDDYADGTITKLFNSLPDNVDIGNPTLSKNSQNIIAFDYEDNTTGEFFIVGCNTETNETSQITDNNTLGYPNFNSLDDKIAFTYQAASSRYQVYYTALLSDKITRSGTSDVGIADYSKWPIYYATGTRTLPTSIKVLPGNSTSKATAIVFPNPCTDKLNVSFTSSATGNGTVQLYHTSGQLLSETSIPVAYGDNSIPLTVPASLHAGCYIIVVSSEHDSWTSRFIKQ